MFANLKRYWLPAVLITAFIVLVAFCSTQAGILAGMQLQREIIAQRAISVAEVQCGLPEDSLEYRGFKMHSNGILEVYVSYEGSDSYSVLAGTMECSLGKG